MFSEKQIGDILSALPDPAFILTRSGRYAAIFGGTDLRYYNDSRALVGKTMQDVLPMEMAAWFSHEIEKALASRQLHIVEYSLAPQDVKGVCNGPSHQLWFEGRVQALDFQVQGEDAVLWVASNITERHEMENRLRAQSERDPLTNLFNRRKFLAALEDQYEIFSRYKIPTTIFIFDVDDFKNVNDRYGHLKGDQVLQIIAQACLAESRVSDIPARFGGDEFVVLMPYTDIQQALQIVKRLSTCITKETIAIGIADGITISGGLNQMLSSDTSVDEVVKRADDNLYQAKREGRGLIIGRHVSEAVLSDQ